MNIPIELLEMRKEYFTKGDNVEIAKEASRSLKKGARPFKAMDVALAIRDGRAKDSKLLIAISQYYKRKKALMQELSNIELAQ